MRLWSLLCCCAYGFHHGSLKVPTAAASDVSRDLVAFEYASDLWIVSRDGGQARRLTATPGAELIRTSHLTVQIAFTATVAGTTEAYVVPTAGVIPAPTYHPGSIGLGVDARRSRVVSGIGRTSAPKRPTSASGRSAWRAVSRSAPHARAFKGTTTLPTRGDRL